MLPDCFSLMESFSSLTVATAQEAAMSTKLLYNGQSNDTFRTDKNIFRMTKAATLCRIKYLRHKSLEVLGSKCAVLCVRDPYTHTHTP